MTSAKQAIDHVDAEKWGQTSIDERLRLLYLIRTNMLQDFDELNQAVADRNNQPLGSKKTYTADNASMFCMLSPANNVAVAIDLYESLKKTGKPLQPNSVTKITDELYDVNAFPLTYKDSLIYSTQTMFLRVKSTEEPVVQNPMEKPIGITGILGGGNVANSAEMFKSLFFDNRVVVYKGHPLNIESDKVWQKILKPLEDHKSLVHCESSDGPALCADPRLDQIYFTGSADTANAIEKASKTLLVAECGGVAPVIIVPGDRPWTNFELKHQAMQISSAAKLFGGAFCARPQMIVTCKNWPQRQEFLDCMARSLREETPAQGSFYPGADKKFENFQSKYPDAQVIEPEQGKHGDKSRFLWIPDVDSEESFICRNEAFTQVLGEIAVDSKPTADDFLPKAVHFCNNKLYGSLSCTIIVDNQTLKASKKTVEQTVTDLKYGAIGVNGNGAFAVVNPYLSWGGCGEEGKDPIQSGRGNFGNAFGYNNIEKSIIYDYFIAPGQVRMANKSSFDYMFSGLAKLALQPSLINIVLYLTFVVVGLFKSKDF
jgi:acyl-CoA reductase-like NAD-dependent aldehyde dehydrogenase